MAAVAAVQIRKLAAGALLAASHAAANACSGTEAGRCGRCSLCRLAWADAHAPLAEGGGAACCTLHWPAAGRKFACLGLNELSGKRQSMLRTQAGRLISPGQTCTALPGDELQLSASWKDGRRSSCVYASLVAYERVRTAYPALAAEACPCG
jgi:hypothetical protein